MCPAIVIIISRIYYLAESIYTSSTLLTSGMLSPLALYVVAGSHDRSFGKAERLCLCELSAAGLKDNVVKII